MTDSLPHKNQKRRTVVSVIAFVFGGLTAAVGVWLVGAYFFEAIINRIGEPDQSLLFWYLPLVFIGIMFLAVGVAAIVFGVYWRRRPSR